MNRNIHSRRIDLYSNGLCAHRTFNDHHHRMKCWHESPYSNTNRTEWIRLHGKYEIYRAGAMEIEVIRSEVW